MYTPFQIDRVTHPVPEADIASLAELLIDVVEGGASVGFMSPLSRERALSFWHAMAVAVANGERILLVARTGNQIVGTVQVIVAMPDNQPHRGDIAKLQVHSSARKHGLGEQLMRAAEDHARAAGKTMLVLDTVTDSAAARLYARLGWIKVGDIPDYALFPDGAYCSTTYFYKKIA